MNQNNMQIKNSETISNDRLKDNLNAYEQIFNIENRLRYFIYTTLAKEKLNWWKSIGNKNIKDRVLDSIKQTCAEKLKKERQMSGKDFQLMHEIYYTTLDDLWKIINEKWSNFSNYFGDNGRNDLGNRFRIIVSIRNQVMHSNLIKTSNNDDLNAFNSFLDLKISTNNSNQCLVTVNEKYIKNELTEELNSHLKKYDHFDGIELKTNVFDSIKTEWWYRDYLEIDNKQCDQYYNHIDHANKIIDNRYRGFKVEVTKLFRNHNLQQLGIQILSQINE